jgi:hypothetical protein
MGAVLSVLGFTRESRGSHRQFRVRSEVQKADMPLDQEGNVSPTGLGTDVPGQREENSGSPLKGSIVLEGAKVEKGK